METDALGKTCRKGILYKKYFALRVAVYLTHLAASGR
jgi:hypothetical protein